MKVVGIMSGTSLDGIDVALSEISGLPPGLTVTPIAWGTIPYDPDLRRRALSSSAPGSGSVDEICRLNFELGRAMANAVLQFLESKGIRPENIDLIGSHGQTVHHIPPAEGEPGSTLQIGEPSIIAELTGITTVADFRPRDMAAGGQGAPLVPLVDDLLFRAPGKTRVLQNIGGIGNLTLLSERAGSDGLVAFDTGPGNMVIDALLERFTGGVQSYDRDGEWALSGTVNSALLEYLLDDPYYRAEPPKSTGRELYGDSYVERLLQKGRELGLASRDVVATATMLTVETIARAYERWIIPKWGLDEVVLGGGGAYNPAMVRWLQNRLPGVHVTDHAALGFPSDAKEAIAFAVLAYLAVRGVPNNLPAATGAKVPVVMGKVVPGRDGWRVLTRP